MKTPSPKLQQEDVVIERRTLVIALDETGHEEFKDTGPLGKPPIFGLAGIAGLGPSLVHAERLWRAMKAISFGGKEQPIHASGKMMTREQLDAISEFFRRSRLGRFAYLMKKPPIQIPETNALHLLRPLLMQELIEFVGSLPVLPDDIVIVIEKSDRLLPKVIDVFQGLKLDVDGKPIPIKGLFSEKMPPQPLLEMCDHVCHRAQRQCKFHLGCDLLPEFVAVFPRDAPFARYKELQVASYSGGKTPRWTISFAEHD
jgi:hypothetical protein